MRRFKLNIHFVIIHSRNNGLGFLMEIADFDLQYKRLCYVIDSDPVQIGGDELISKDIVFFADDDRISLRIDTDDIERFFRRYSQAFPLPNGVINDAGMTSQHPTLFIDDSSFRYR